MMKKPQVDMRTTFVFLSAAFATLPVGVADGADRSPPIPVFKPSPADEAAGDGKRSTFDPDSLLGHMSDLAGLQHYGPASADTGEASASVADRALVMLDSVLEKLGLSWEEVRSATSVQPLPALAQSPYDRGFEADGEVRLAIGLSEGVSFGPAYGLQLQGDELRRAGKDVDHQFKLGARFNF